MAGNTTVKLYITGDASGVSKAARDAERALGRLSGNAKASFGRMAEFAGGFGLAMGAGGVVGMLQDSVAAFQESEKAAARMGAQLDTLGQNTASVRQQIEDAIKAQSEFGAFDDEDLQDAFTRILRSTGDVRESLDLNNLAMDIARARNVDLATAAEAVAKAADGQFTSLKRMGVEITKGMSATEALAAAQAKFGGQAEAYGETAAAAADRAKIAWQNAQEEIGAKAAQAFVRGAEGAQRLAGSIDDVVSAAGGLQGVLVAGGAFAGVKMLGPDLLAAAGGMRAMSNQMVVWKRSGIGKDGPFGKVAWGLTVKRAATTAGSALTTLAGGPMGVAALAAGGLALGIAKAASEMTTMGEEADDVTDALQRLADAQLALKDATFGVKQAQIDAKNAPYEVAQATRDYQAAIVAADTALRVHGASSKEYAQAQDEVVAAGQRLEAAQLLAEQATLRLEAAMRQLEGAQQQVSADAQQLQSDIGGLIGPAREAGAAMALDALHAGDFAAMGKQAQFQAIALAEALRQSAMANQTLTASARATELQMADLIQTMGRIPNQTEIAFISNALATGQSIDEIRRKLDAIPRNVTFTITQVIRQIGNWFTPPQAATGAAIAGTFDGRDNVPVNVSRGEVILNPQQISMIGRDRVYGALAATGAPTIRAGGSHARGGSPVEKWRGVLGQRQARYDLRFNRLDARLAFAETSTPDDYRDDNPILSAIRTLIRGRIRELRGLVGKVPKPLRAGVWGDIASLRRSLDQYAARRAEPLQPGAPDDTADLEARLAQAEARAAAAGRNLALSESALSTFGGVGAGAGRATIVQFHSIFPPTPDQYRSGAAFMSDAFGRQSYRRTPRIRIGA